MSTFREFIVAAARPMPVILLADVSGSMATEGKIQALNLSVQEMVSAFADEEDLRAEIHVAVITFGGAIATLHIPLTPANQIKWHDMPASGGTPLGAALCLVTSMVEDRLQISARAYRPTIVLISDGQPNDNWEKPLDAMLSSPRCGKAHRMALAIGADADEEVLRRFLADIHGRVFRADEAPQIKQFFHFVTMSVASRSRSANPDLPRYETPDLKDIEF